MHNCKRTRSVLLEMALTQTSQLTPDAVDNCAGCLEELAALRSAVRATQVSLQLAQPSESFWPGYHERLRKRLELNSTESAGWLPPPPTRPAPGLRKLLLTSIRIPVPVAAAALVLFAVAIVFAISSRPTSNVITILTPPSLVTKTIEVPVIQEKLVTRIVYRNAGRTAPAAGATAKATESRIEERTTTDLVGFKPANEAKVTIISGSYRDEK